MDLFVHRFQRATHLRMTYADITSIVRALSWHALTDTLLARVVICTRIGIVARGPIGCLNEYVFHTLIASFLCGLTTTYAYFALVVNRTLGTIVARNIRQRERNTFVIRAYLFLTWSTRAVGSVFATVRNGFETTDGAAYAALTFAIRTRLVRSA